MDDQQLSRIEDRLTKIENRLTTILICVLILVGWLVLVPTRTGALLWFLVARSIVGIAILAAVVLGFLWLVERYQNWRSGDPKEREARMEKEFLDSLKTPDGDQAQ